MTAYGSKMGIHSIKARRARPLMEAARARGVRFPVVKGVDNGGLAIEAKAIDPGIITITRFVSEDWDSAQGVETWTDAQMVVHAAAVMWRLVHRLSPEELRAADYLEPINEADPPGVAGWRAFGRWCREIVRDADAYGVRVCLPAFNAGTPEWDEMVAFAESGVFAAMKAGGHLLAVHEGVFGKVPIDWGFGDRIPNAPFAAGAGSMIGRYRYLYHLLAQRGEVVPCVVTEAYSGDYYGLPPAEQLFRLAWMDRLYRADPNVLGWLPFTIDPSAGWTHQDYTPTYDAVAVDYLVTEKDKPNATEAPMFEKGLMWDWSMYQFTDTFQGHKYEERRWRDTHDWEALRASYQRGEFVCVIVRVGIGIIKDPAFDRITQGLDRIGVPWMTYHVYTEWDPVLTQVKRVGEWLAGKRWRRLWADVEDGSGDAVFARFDAYLKALDDELGFITGLYSGGPYMNRRFTEVQQRTWRHRPTWKAGYPNYIQWAGWVGFVPAYDLHQFTDRYAQPGVPRPADASRIHLTRSLEFFFRPLGTQETAIMFYIRASNVPPELQGRAEEIVQKVFADVEAGGVGSYYRPGEQPPTPPPPQGQGQYPRRARARQALSLRDVRGNVMGAAVPKDAVVTVHMVLARIGPNSSGQSYDERAVLATDGRNCWASLTEALEWVE